MGIGVVATVVAVFWVAISSFGAGFWVTAVELTLLTTGPPQARKNITMIITMAVRVHLNHFMLYSF
jgi:hypothetical protein